MSVAAPGFPEGPWVWRSFGGELVLVTAHSGGRVVLSAGRDAIVTRNAQGILKPIKASDPVACAVEALPDLFYALRAIVEQLEQSAIGNTDVWLPLLKAGQDALAAAAPDTGA